MKFSMLILFLSLSACVGLNQSSTSSKSITFENLQQFQVGSTLSSEVIKALGSQYTRTEQNGYYTLNYNNPENGFQRFSANFYSSDNILFGFVWIPHPNEKELSLTESKNKFKGSTFKEIHADASNPHAISDVVLLKDDKLGVTIRYDKIAETVEAIGKYDVHSRFPAEQKTSKQLPYVL